MGWKKTTTTKALLWRRQVWGRKELNTEHSLAAGSSFAGVNGSHGPKSHSWLTAEREKDIGSQILLSSSILPCLLPSSQSVLAGAHLGTTRGVFSLLPPTPPSSPIKHVSSYEVLGRNRLSVELWLHTPPCAYIGGSCIWPHCGATLGHKGELPWWSSGEEPPWQCTRHGLDPQSRKIAKGSGQLSLCVTTTGAHTL